MPATYLPLRWIAGLAFCLCAPLVPAVEPPLPRLPEAFFRQHDVVALIGGEDLVVASEHGFFELLAARALPGPRAPIWIMALTQGISDARRIVLE